MANAATVTWAGRSIIWALVKGVGSPTEPKNIGWGISADTASANSDVALFGPQTEARVAGTSSLVTTSFLADTYQVTGTITCLTTAKTITEAGLFDTTNAASTSTLSATQTAAATTVSVAASIGPATGTFYIQIDNEVQLVTTGAGGTVFTVTRSQLGSVTAGHAVAAVATSGGDGGAWINAGAGNQSQTYASITAKGGSMFAHADYAGIALAINDSIAYTWKDELTGLLLTVMGGGVLWHLIAPMIA